MDKWIICYRCVLVQVPVCVCVCVGMSACAWCCSLLCAHVGAYSIVSSSFEWGLGVGCGVWGVGCGGEGVGRKIGSIGSSWSPTLYFHCLFHQNSIFGLRLGASMIAICAQASSTRLSVYWVIRLSGHEASRLSGY